MALSGVILVGFTAGHMAGNLQVFAGPDVFNNYACGIYEIPPLLWGTRLALLFAFGTHIYSAYSLTMRNRAARNGRYAVQKDLATDYAARTMVWSGVIFLFYLIYHLAHLTLGGKIFGSEALFGVEGYVFDDLNRYNNLVVGMQHWAIALPYMIASVCVAFHMFHGFFSMFQTLGASHPKYDQLRRDVAIFLSVIIGIGFILIPLTALWGAYNPDSNFGLFPTDASYQAEACPAITGGES